MEDKSTKAKSEFQNTKSETNPKNEGFKFELRTLPPILKHAEHVGSAKPTITSA
jgi:hypothetical protein